MPVYDYECVSCGNVEEKVHSIAVLGIQQYCSVCNGRMNKLLSAPMVHVSKVEYTDIFALIYHLDSKECKLRLEQEGKDCGPISCVLVDEAQFLSKDQVSQLTEIVDTLGIPVLCYGLRTDFMGEPFEGSKYLLAWADEIEEVKTICHCGKKATMNIKIDENGKRIECGEQVEIGGNEKYVSVCRDHFFFLRH